MSINGCINEQNVIFPYSAILFILKREENSYTCYVSELEDIMLSEIDTKKLDTKKIDCVIPLI